LFLRRGTCDGKSIIHPRNLWVRGSNLTGGHNRLSCPRSAGTALKPYLTLLFLRSVFTAFLTIYWFEVRTSTKAYSRQSRPHLADNLDLKTFPFLLSSRSSCFSDTHLAFASMHRCLPTSSGSINQSHRTGQHF